MNSHITASSREEKRYKRCAFASLRGNLKFLLINSLKNPCARPKP